MAAAYVHHIEATHPRHTALDGLVGVERAQQRRLSRAALADKIGEIALAKTQVHILQHRLVIVANHHVVKLHNPLLLHLVLVFFHSLSQYFFVAKIQ